MGTTLAEQQRQLWRPWPGSLKSVSRRSACPSRLVSEAPGFVAGSVLISPIYFFSAFFWNGGLVLFKDFMFLRQIHDAGSRKGSDAFFVEYFDFPDESKPF